MKHGNWLPISKALLRFLPKDRPYTELEAAASLQVDYDDGNQATVNGYSALWSWSRSRVRRFLKRMDVALVYPDPTFKRQNQKGQIAVQIRDRSEKKKGQIRLIDSKQLEEQKDRSENEKGQIRDRSQDATTYPNTDPTTYTPEKSPQSCPVDHILDLYHKLLPELPRVYVFSDKRKGWLRSRWKEKIKSQSGLQSNTLKWWEGYFTYVSQSDFLMGRLPPSKGRDKPFKAGFEWLINKSNLVNVVEGKYHA